MALLLAQLTAQDAAIPDPGSGAAIIPDRWGTITFNTGGSGETNTLPDPLAADMRLRLTLKTDGGGDRVITASTKINQSSNTIMTFADAGDTIELVSIVYGTGYRWSVNGNDGVALS